VGRTGVPQHDRCAARVPRGAGGSRRRADRLTRTKGGGMLLEGRVAVITGGGSGIGRAIAERFYREGAKVAIASRNAKTLQTVAMEMNKGDHRIVPFRCDVTDRDEVEVLIGNVIEVWDRVDILVNNAGLSGITPATPSPEMN